MQQTKLIDVAQVLKGFPFRLTEQGKVPCLRPKDFDRTGKFLDQVELHIAVQDSARQYLLQPGDILLQCKGPANRACAFPEKLKEAVAIDIFTVIRPEKVAPIDLINYFNSEKGQTALKSLRRDDDQWSVSRKDLESLMVTLG
ncbi:MAG: hypothetical protein AAGA85_07295 [Bacteroidota bacterium]